MVFFQFSSVQFGSIYVFVTLDARGCLAWTSLGMILFLRSLYSKFSLAWTSWVLLYFFDHYVQSSVQFSSVQHNIMFKVQFNFRNWPITYTVSETGQYAVKAGCEWQVVVRRKSTTAVSPSSINGSRKAGKVAWPHAALASLNMSHRSSGVMPLGFPKAQARTSNSQSFVPSNLQGRHGCMAESM